MSSVYGGSLQLILFFLPSWICPQPPHSFPMTKKPTDNPLHDRSIALTEIAVVSDTGVVSPGQSQGAQAGNPNDEALENYKEDDPLTGSETNGGSPLSGTVPPNDKHPKTTTATEEYILTMRRRDIIIPYLLFVTYMLNYYDFIHDDGNYDFSKMPGFWTLGASIDSSRNLAKYSFSIAAVVFLVPVLAFAFRWKSFIREIAATGVFLLLFMAVMGGAGNSGMIVFYFYCARSPTTLGELNVIAGGVVNFGVTLATIGPLYRVQYDSIVERWNL